MIDALLFAVRDAIQKAGWGYDAASCDIRVNGQPPPSCGDFFVAIHEEGTTSTMDNALDEYFDFDVTLTQRVTIPLDRVGDQLLAMQLARRPGPRGQPSFNARLDALKTFLHMNWLVMGNANNYLAALNPESGLIYGFCEPARYRSMEIPHLEGGQWFFADPQAEEVALVGSLHFADCRRLQALQHFV